MNDMTESDPEYIIDRTATGAYVVNDPEALCYDEMTEEHLGPEATHADLLAFQEACEAVLPWFNGVRILATDYIYNRPDRLTMGCCVYCDQLIDDRTLTPEVDDDAGWRELAPDHATDCEWILTRAHRVNL